MKQTRLLLGSIFTGIIVLLSSCSSTKHLNEGEYLLVKNKITTNKKDLPSKGDLYYLAKPVSNHQFLGLFPLKAAVYQSLSPKKEGAKERKWKQWMRKTFGEEPVLADSSAIMASCHNMQQYLFNKGYFQSEINNEIHYKKKKAKVVYNITVDQCYTLNETKYQIEDSLIEKIILRGSSRSLLQKGIPFDVDILDDERERICESMNNHGYYYFTIDDISYKIDSNLKSHRFNLTVVVNNSREWTDSNGNKQVLPHRKYYIRNISIYASDIENDNSQTDSISYSITNKDNSTYNYQLYFDNNLKYRPKSLIYPLTFHPNSLYSSWNNKSSYNRYNDMQNFRFIRLSYQETAESKENLSDTGWLDCQIQLSKLEDHIVDLEVLGKDIGDDYGIGLNLKYQNRNTFHGGEILFANLMFSNEFQKTSNYNDENEEIPMWRYRNFEIGGEIGLRFPKMLLPFPHKSIRPTHRATTNLSLGSYFQQRDHYSRFNTNTNLKYEWKPRNSVSHSLTLIDINIVKIFKDSVFSRNLAKYSQRIQEKYTDHVLIGTNYKLIYSSLRGTKRKNYYLLRLNLNAYGNTLYGIFHTIGGQQNDQGQYTLFGTPFTGFVSGEFDFTYNIMLWEKSSFVIHTDAGIGAPTFNASTLPFERSFYLGGSNSMRAWNLRSLGPGSYHGNLSNFESTGDIKLEFNLEMRHPIYKNFYAAYFLDGGNIWNLRSNTELPNGEFKWDRFYEEIALDGGIGLRWDISFLVLRLDAAIPLYTPYYVKGERWIDEKSSFKDLRFCFGVGYPF